MTFLPSNTDVFEKISVLMNIINIGKTRYINKKKIVILTNFTYIREIFVSCIYIIHSHYIFHANFTGTKYS